MWACTHKQADQPPPRGHAASCCCRPVPTACVPACYSTCACVCAGELTLRGLVLPVGGIKEKLVAAQAAGMARVLVPARNMPDVLVGGGGVGALLLLLRRCYRSGRGAAQLPNPCRLPLISPCTPPPPPPLQLLPPLPQAEVPADVRAALQVVPCERLEEVLLAAFDPPIVVPPAARL